ncbi:MAG: ABC transporter ATP-binding protein [Rhodothermales bacterium]|nr:ABC transporter ATP-binding protein [Rhodothermales bacterium]
MAQPFLEATGLSKTYRGSFRKSDVTALINLSLTVEGGEIFGLLGPNGAGKTTFVKLVLGLVKPSAGHATLMGRSVRNWRARNAIGYLPENHRFPEFLTAFQMLSLYGQLAGLDRSAVRNQIHEVLELVGMLEWMHVEIRKYSKGMMQRVGLAQALLGNPSIVFLDEPTDGVDPIGRRDIRNVLLHLKSEGKTVFVNSHLLSELEMVCSRVAIINKGRMIQEGTLESLLSRAGTYLIASTKIPRQVLSDCPQILPLGDSNADHSHSSEIEHPGSGGEIWQYEVEAVSRRMLNELMDKLRRASVEIESIERVKDSLEELFVRSVNASDRRSNAENSDNLRPESRGRIEP